MKKNYLLIAAAAAMFAACSNVDSFKSAVDDNETVMIGFETYHEKSTRATATGEINNPSDFTSAHGGFGVWGFKGSSDDIVAANPTVDVTATSITTVFNNVKVWYKDNTEDEEYTPENANTANTHYHFTYAIPKYWDKGSEYTFFAYAPYDEAATKGKTDEAKAAATTVYLDETTGKITVKAIPSIQDISTSNSSSSPADDDLVFTGTDDSHVTDYLMATYAAEQKFNATNQQTLHPGTAGSTTYADVAQTVGFTFGHMLSKLQINVMPNDQYLGVEGLDVKFLSLTNMPTRAQNTATTVFTQTAPTAAAGTFAPNAYSTTLQVINSDNNTNTYATARQSLYVLKDGQDPSGTDSNNDPVFEDTNKPESQTQQFNYYIAPNTPASAYKLNISYHITYTDGTEEDVVKTDLALPQNFSSMAQNNSYILNIKIALQEILFTVEQVVGWTTQTLDNVVVGE